MRVDFSANDAAGTEAPVRCWQCNQLLAEVSDFAGRLELACSRCPALVVYTGSAGDALVGQRLTESTAGRPAPESLKRLVCGLCHRPLLYASEFAGVVLKRCAKCKTMQRFTGAGVNTEDTGDVLPALAALSHESFVQMMEDHWSRVMKDRTRTRAHMAVGLRFKVFMRDGFRCRYCGVSADDGAILHADHVIPESKGGPTILDNLVTACIDCNLGKSDKLLPPR